MNFQGLGHVEDYKTYLDTAFNRASKKSREVTKAREKVDTAKNRDLKRVETVREYLSSTLVKIQKSFPTMDDLPDFYYELCKLYFSIEDLKKSISSLNWASEKIGELAKETSRNIKRASSADESTKYRNAFYGRVDSVMRRISKHLKSMEEARRAMKAFPAVKQDAFTVAVVGFPNVGKSTLISSITGSDLAIDSYSFTTRRLLIGNLRKGSTKMQFIDTPGTLNRDDKKNDIEKQADLAMELAADMMVFVFDPTEMYPLEKQERLLKKVKKYKKPIIEYISKTDIADPDIVDEVKQKHGDAMMVMDGLLEKIMEKRKEIGLSRQTQEI